MSKKKVIQFLCSVVCFGTLMLMGQQQTPTSSASTIISISRLKNQTATIEFQGTLQSAPSLSGPWRDEDARSPLTVNFNSELAFYRARRTADIFTKSSPLEFTLSGAFSEHFDLAFAGLPDGIFPPQRAKPYFSGSLTLDGNTIAVRIRVRGNSSLQECPFPKLKVKISRSNRENTPFANAREIKIGTHCAEGGTGTIGRLRDERAAFREVLIYEAMNRLGFISPKVRRSNIRYIDPADPTGDWPVQRMAFIFEHLEVLAERLNGRALEDEEVATLSDAQFDPQLITELKLFHALVGNWDYALATTGARLWNTEVIRFENGILTPVAGDFDLATWVTGEVVVTAPRDFKPDLEGIRRQMVYQLETIAAEHSNARFEIARNRFLSLRSDIEDLIHQAEVDDDGRHLAINHVSVFYESLLAQNTNSLP